MTAPRVLAAGLALGLAFAVAPSLASCGARRQATRAAPPAPPQPSPAPAAPAARAPGAPGRWEIAPARLVAGTRTRLQVRYVHGIAPLPPGAAHVVQIEPLSVQDLLHARPSEAVALVPHGDRPLPEVVLEPLRVENLGYAELVLRFPSGLQPGEAFALDYGNRADDGSIEALVAPATARGLTFALFTEPGPGDPRQSWLDEGWGDGLPDVDVVAGQPSRVRLFGPTRVRTGESFRLRLAVTDEYDSRSDPPFAGAIELEAPTGLSGLPPRVALGEADGSTAAIEGLACASPGVCRVRARLGEAGEWFESNPIVVSDEAGPGVYWGSLHNHTRYSEGWGDALDVTYAHARDVAGLDFFAASDHYAQLPRGQGLSRLTMWRERRFLRADEGWADTLRAAAAFDEPGRFATLLGYELSMNDSGHHVVCWSADDAGADDAWASHFLPHYTDLVDDLARRLAGTHALLLPHRHAAAFPFLTLARRLNDFGEEQTPVMEVYSDWGEGLQPVGARDAEGRFGGLRSGESFLWALEQGHELGVIADSDNHAGLTGRRQAFGVAPSHDHPPGLTAARLERLDAGAVVEAYRRRRTYGTTGERLYLDVRAGETEMGGVHRTDGGVAIDVAFAGTAPIARVRLFDGQALAGEWSPPQPGTRDASCRFECRPWEAGGGPAAGDAWTPARDGRTLALVPASREERHFVARDLGSVVKDGVRFTDADRAVVYGFRFRPGERAQLELDLDQEFRVELSRDGRRFETVLEEAARVHEGGNRAVRQLDLTDFVAEQGEVFVRLSDSHPEDGWGARLRRLAVTSDGPPEPLAAPDGGTASAWRARRHAYLVEVEQGDGQLAWSSPIWVERASLPDLRWDAGPDGRPRLTNAGNADATDVEVGQALDEHPFALEPIACRSPGVREEVCLVWTDRVDASRVRVHVRWHGTQTLTGRVVVEGARAYATAASYDLRARRGTHADRGDGTVDFTFPSMPPDDFRRSVGIDLEVATDPARPTALRLELDAEALVRCGAEETVRRALVLPLNGRRSDRSLVRSVIPRLAAGGSWTPDAASPGLWCADPADRLLERNEEDNLWPAPGPAAPGR